MALNVTVTDSTGAIIVGDGTNNRAIVKQKCSIKADGDQVVIMDGDEIALSYPYDVFTSPTAANANAMVALIEAFLDTAGTPVTISGALPAGDNNIGNVDIASAIPSGTNNIGAVGSNTKAAATSITRAANTTTYDVNDVMNDTTATTMLQFTVARANDLKGWIVGGKAVSNAAQATLPNIDLLLFSSDFAIAADNAAFAPTYAQMQTYIGKVRFQTWVNRGVRCESDGSVESAFQFTPASGTQIIYGVLVMQNAYIPISAETLQFFLDVEQY